MSLDRRPGGAATMGGLIDINVDGPALTFRRMLDARIDEESREAA